MDSLADPLILGFPELSALGCWMEPPDDSGRRWIQFTTMGIRLPIIQSIKISAKTVKIEGTVEVEGPALHSVKLVMTAAEYEDAVY